VWQNIFNFNKIKICSMNIVLGQAARNALKCDFGCTVRYGQMILHCVSFSTVPAETSKENSVSVR
jgi:hypothetical protein